MSAVVKLGAGEATVSTGVPLLDRLIASLALAGGFDVELRVEAGELEAEVEAAGDGFGAGLAPLLRPGAHGQAAVPADEALAWLTLEASGRPAVYSNADLEGAGGLGTDLAARFLEPLARSAGLTLHVRLVEGEESDHVLEAIFKSLGVALGQACRA